VFSFLKVFKNSSLDFSVLQTDMHSHLIPGIDDGAKTLEKSLLYIKALQDLGFQKIITTPHIMGDHYPNTAEVILSGLKDIQNALEKENNSIEIHAAAEYYVDEYFVELLDNHIPLLTVSDNKVLIEFSTFAPPSNAFDIIFRLQAMGYQPILAHPERYVYYEKRPDIFQEFKEKGCLLQLNLLSLIGHYGDLQKKMAFQLLSNKLIDYLATDLHNSGHIKQLSNCLKDNKLQRILRDYEFQNSLL
jgi:tyrosine-protein phosphatase YwqE